MGMYDEAMMGEPEQQEDTGFGLSNIIDVLFLISMFSGSGGLSGLVKKGSGAAKGLMGKVLKK